MMNNRENRMEILKANGVDTNKFFNIPSDLKAGDKFEVQIDANGNHIIVKCKDSNHDEVMKNIIEDGYVRNSKLHRRWVMAQMFRALNYKCRWTGNEGFHGYLRDKGYMYSIDMMIEETHVLAELEKRDKDTFEERSIFFNKNVIVNMLNDYMVKLDKYIGTIKPKKCKGLPYKTIKGKDIFVEDIPKKIYHPLNLFISEVSRVNNYADINRTLVRFRRNMIVLPHNTEMSADFIDAYKGNGAYYTLKNMAMFHNCKIYDGYGGYTAGCDAVCLLNNLRREYKGEGWRMMGLLKKVIKSNNFDFLESCKRVNNK